MTPDEIRKWHRQERRRVTRRCSACSVGGFRPCAMHLAYLGGIAAVAAEAERRERIEHHGRLP